MLLLVLGLGLSIPLIIFGSTMLLKLMERFPVIITLGAALLGFVAGEMALSDPSLARWESSLHAVSIPFSLACAAIVVGIGMFLGRRAKAETIAG